LTNASRENTNMPIKRKNKRITSSELDFVLISVPLMLGRATAHNTILSTLVACKLNSFGWRLRVNYFSPYFYAWISSDSVMTNK
jgi:hypothetical protein